MSAAAPTLDEPTANEPTAGEALTLSDEEAELVAAEAASASHVLAEPRRTDAARLADAAASRAVPPELLGILADIAVSSVRGGRARRLYRAEGEKHLTGVLLRTPAGREIQRGLSEVNTALETLAGHRLEAVRVAMRAPGNFTLRLQSEHFAITLAMTADTVSVDSLSA